MSPQLISVTAVLGCWRQRLTEHSPAWCTEAADGIAASTKLAGHAKCYPGVHHICWCVCRRASATIPPHRLQTKLEPSLAASCSTCSLPVSCVEHKQHDQHVQLNTQWSKGTGTVSRYIALQRNAVVYQIVHSIERSVSSPPVLDLLPRAQERLCAASLSQAKCPMLVPVWHSCFGAVDKKELRLRCTQLLTKAHLSCFKTDRGHQGCQLLRGQVCRGLTCLQCFLHPASGRRKVTSRPPQYCDSYYFVRVGL